MKNKLIAILILFTALQGCTSYASSTNSGQDNSAYLDNYFEQNRQQRTAKYYHNKLVKGEKVYFNPY